jgi:hypothetical protein
MAKYEQQVQNAMERLDQSLARLRDLIKRGENANAIHFMERGELKDRYEDLQNIINISYNGNYGARGVRNTGNL